MKNITKKRLKFEFWLVFVISLILIPSVSAAMSVTCNTDGSISIKDAKKSGELWAQKKGSDESYFPVDGKWLRYEYMIGIIKVKRYKFESNEGIFVQGESTKYNLKLKKKLYTITCPAFVFACNILNTTIESCYMRNNTFYAKFFAENIPLQGKKVLRFGSPYSFEYKVWLEGGMAYSRTPKKYRDEFKDILITQKKLTKGNKYKFVWNATPNNAYENITTESSGESVNGKSSGIEELKVNKVTRFSMFYDCEKGNFYKEAECKDMPYCRYSGDCLNNEYCEKDTCQELDCDDCEYIQEHKCKKYECCESSMCDENEECSQNKCIKLGCSEAEVVKDHQCFSLGCKDDEYTADHTCVKLECSEYEQAVNHQCEILNCADDEYIKEHKCEKLECKWYEKPLAHDCVNFINYNIYKYKDNE
ncbi:hypothetical protein HY636_02485 [Candidatus Woesearchaeota archaeon]|nr:hypothetical protein [Candidatus Woesearchaeota archaeon]